MPLGDGHAREVERLASLLRNSFLLGKLGENFNVLWNKNNSLLPTQIEAAPPLIWMPLPKALKATYGDPMDDKSLRLNPTSDTIILHLTLGQVKVSDSSIHPLEFKILPSSVN